MKQNENGKKIKETIKNRMSWIGSWKSKGLIHRTDVHGAGLRHTFDQCPVFYGGLFIDDFRIGTTGETNGCRAVPEDNKSGGWSKC